MRLPHWASVACSVLAAALVGIGVKYPDWQGPLDMAAAALVAIGHGSALVLPSIKGGAS